jgi:hypothetical protein
MKFILLLKHWQLFLLFIMIGIIECFLSGNLLFLGLFFPLLWAFLILFYGQQKLTQLGFKRIRLSLLTFIFCFIIIVFVAISSYSIFPDRFTDILDYLFPPLALFSIAAAFWILFLAAKTITKIEYKREFKFKEYFDNFLFLSIPIVGIWVLQPKINYLFQQEPATL